MPSQRSIEPFRPSVVIVMKSVRIPSGLAERPVAVPPDIYIPLVDSLYKDGRTLFTGTFFVVGSILTTFWKTGEPLFLVCAFAVVAVACTRGLMMRAYARVRTTVKSNAEARRWERRYVPERPPPSGSSVSGATSRSRAPMTPSRT